MVPVVTSAHMMKAAMDEAHFLRCIREIEQKPDEQMTADERAFRSIELKAHRESRDACRNGRRALSHAHFERAVAIVQGRLWTAGGIR